jgi:hypothetical protein
MKLLIILALISSVYCGIRNNITVVDNNTVYLAHTHNCAIYKIDINTAKPEIVVGDVNRNYFGDRDAFLGTDALIKNPTSIITDYDKKVLFFVDDSSNIKKADIIPQSIKGVETGIIENNISNPGNIYNGSSYNFAASPNTNSIYFVTPTDIFSIEFDTNSNSAIPSQSSTTLPSGTKFIDIAFYDGFLYYCYSNENGYNINKRANNIFDIGNDVPITIDTKPTNITGFTFSSNLLVIAGNIAGNSELYIYSSNANDNYSFNNSIPTDNKYTVLCDYKAVVYNVESTNNSIIARAVNSQFYKINITNGNATNFDIQEIKTIAVNSTDRAIKSYNIDTDYLYNSKYNENVMLYLNQNQSNLKVIKYTPSNFRTTKLNLNSNLNIRNITINNTNTLFVATDNDIYYCNNITEDSEQYNLCNVNISFTGNIISLNYVNKSLHFMTDQHYYKYDIKDDDNNIITADGNTEDENSNLEKQERVKKTNDTDSLENINDFVIDNNYEVGYIAFNTRLKWFYV